MADENQNQPVAPAPVLDPAAHNADVAARLAAQDAAGQSAAGKPSDFAPVASALDELAAAKQKEIETAAAAAAVQPAATATPAATPPAKTPEELAAEAAAKEAADKAAAQAAAAAAAPKEDPFKDVPGLPANSAPKASEAWNALKAKAAQEITVRDSEITQLKQQVQELTTRVNTPTTQQLEAEKQMQEMTEWRAKLDLKFDPRFTQFDQKINENHEFIYAQLRKRADVVGENVIDEIKKFGGPEKCNLTSLFTKLADPTLQRVVESKMADALMLEHNKEQAIKQTEANMSDYMKQRQEAFTNAQTSHTTATKGHLDQMLGALDWFKNPKDAEKPEIEKLKGELAAALQDDSPQMRAILLAGFAKMVHVQNLHSAQEAELKTTKAALAEAQGLLDRIKNSSTSRLRESAAAPGAQPAPPKPQNQFTTPAVDALDALAKQVTEARAAKGV